MSHMTVAVLFGGQSSEHEVSRRSAYTILTNLPRDRYDAVMVGITKSGVWRLYTGDPAKIPDGSWESDPGCRPAFFSPSREFPGLLVLEDGRLREIPVDVVFPALHGKNGEDGAPQGLFQLSGVPCVGCSASASVLCMDKAIANSLLETAGIPQAHYLWFFARNYKTGAAKIKVKVAARLGYPVFVKPANAGSSVGVSKVLREEDLDAAVEKAAREDSKIVIEEAITGQEVECAVLGNAEPQASGAGEIGAAAEFYDYDDKYVNGEAQLYLPARIPEETAETIRKTALRAYRMLGCTGLARVDFFVRRSDGAVLLNELNTLPGFTAISMYPKLWEAAGLPLPELIDRLIRLALEERGPEHG